VRAQSILESAQIVRDHGHPIRRRAGRRAPLPAPQAHKHPRFLRQIIPRYSGGQFTAPGLGHLAALTATTALALWSYLLCVFCDPGRVPPGWEPDPESGAAAVQVKRRGGGGPRHCSKCAAPKPPRAHHCRRCGRCVTRMDHHCVWVNGCIGHGNYRAFLLLLLYLTAAATHALCLLLALDAALVALALGLDEDSRAAAAAVSGGALAAEGGGGARGGELGAAAAARRRVGWRGPLWAHCCLQVFATAAALPIVSTLAMLLAWNLRLLGRNTTTIEHHEGVNASTPGAGLDPAGARRPAAGRKNPFDLGGFLANAAAVLGEDVGGWVLPLRPAAEGDGLAFPTAPPE
jgi:palmitoyltransferase